MTSLYFDTPYDSALRERLDGVNRREKFRLRYYGTDLSFFRLEKKYKINGLCGKRAITLNREQAELLLKGKYRFLLDSQQPLLQEFYSKLQGKLLRPKTVVCYDREAFVYGPGNVRITLDRNLRTTLPCRDFLISQSFPLRMTEEGTVLEVKYDNFLPDLVSMAVQVKDRRASSCSKYALCRRLD